MNSKKSVTSISYLLTALFLIFLPLSATAAISEQERTALIDLYNNTGGGQDWLNESGWMGAAGTECDWFGVKCNDDKTSVIELILKGNQLFSALPETIGNLTHLQSLDLSGNYIGGSIPAALENLVNLRSLDLSDNYFDGEIPESLGNLANLQFLDLSNNFLTQPEFPVALTNLANLTSLNLSGNMLGGSIPSSLGNLTRLQSLNLSYSNLSGPIPETLGGLAELESLILDGNAMGSIPAFIGNMDSLRTLGLCENQLSGNIPEFLGNLTMLENLDLSANQLSGGIPEFLGTMINLKSLNLSYNPLGGVIPDFLQHMSSLEILGLNDSQLSGSIPESIGNVLNLRSLQLADNQLTGNIPESIGSLASLESLGLLNNQLTGKIPSSLGNLINMDFLTLSHNQLSGAIPDTMGNLANLAYFEAQSNSLSGEIPSSFINLTKLHTLRLNNNQLIGAIPPLSMSALGSLNLSFNRLSGAIPSSLSTLGYLYLNGNMLSGQVPDEFEDYYIRHLDLKFNALYPRDAQMAQFLSDKDPIIWITQTVAPGNFAATASTSSAQLSWNRIAFSEGNGRHEIFKSLNSGGPYTLAGSTTSKTDTSYYLPGLSPNTNYYLVIRAVSNPHEQNLNTVISEFSPELSVRTAAPPSTDVHIGVNPVGCSFNVDGVIYNTPQTFSWAVGSSHQVSVISPQGSGGTRFVFAGWSDGGATSHTIIVPADSTTFTANFTTQYLLTASVSPQAGGKIIVSLSSPDGYYESGSLVQLRASANSGYAFSAWNGDLTGTTNPQSVTMSAPRNVTAVFRITGSFPSRLPPGIARRPPPRRDRTYPRLPRD